MVLATCLRPRRTARGLERPKTAESSRGSTLLEERRRRVEPGAHAGASRAAMTRGESAA